MKRRLTRFAWAVVWIVGIVPAIAQAGPAERLAEAVRFRTLSHQDPAALDAEAFAGFHAFLERTYPKVHAGLTRHVIGDWSLLYVFEGREPELAPILWTAHFDVVPVIDPSAWTHPPYEGVIADGYVWGRGTLDDKAGVIGMLEAAERLLAEGFQPRRTLYLAFGHDEEIGGAAGAGATAAWLQERGVQLLFSLDEGFAIVDGALPGIDGPVALIGIAEKGYLTLELVAHAAGGHSSTPPRSTAIGRLAEAVRRLEANPMPARMDGVVGSTLDAIAPHLSLVPRLALSNRWLTGGMLESRFSEDRAMSAMIRTTTAVTMVRGGVKENVLPSEATATVNFRIAPGDTVDDVVTHVRRVIEDPEVEIRVDRGTEASPVADVESPGYRLLVSTLGELVPEAPVIPGLVVGGTDSKHYAKVADDSFRFTPFLLGAGDLSRIHGVDERISVSNFEGLLIDFYVALARAADGI